MRGAWECAGAEREEEAAWRSSRISTMLPLTSQLSGKNLELQPLVSMMLTGSHLCLENTPVKFEKKLIERDRELGFLICWRVFFVGRERAQKDLGAVLDSVSVCFGRCDFLFELDLVC